MDVKIKKYTLFIGISLAFFCLASPAYGATRTWDGGGGDGVCGAGKGNKQPVNVIIYASL